MSGLVARVARVAVMVLVLLGSACKSRSTAKPAPVAKGQEEGGSQLASAGAGSGPVPRCVRISKASLVVGEPGAVQAGEDGPLELPFGTELGTALAFPQGYAVPVLRTVGKGREAELLFVSGGLELKARLPLGAVHATEQAPQLVQNGDALLAVVPDSDAAGGVLRLVTIDAPWSVAKVTYGAELQVGSDESDAFSVAVSQGRALLAWDEWDPKAKKAALRAASFSKGVMAQADALTWLPVGDAEAEAPRLLPRAAGFWLVWVSSARRAEKATHRAERQPDKGAALSVVSQGRGEEESESAVAVEMERRWLSVLKLDPSGVPVSEKVSLSKEAGHVLGFDAVSLGENLLVVWRDEPAPGMVPKGFEVAELREDGSVERHSIELPGSRSGPGELLSDARSVPARAWLSVTDAEGQVLLGELGGPVTAQAFIFEPALALSRLVAAQGREFLVAEPKGRAVALGVVACAHRGGVP
jgi:hypothetical protein